MGTEFSPPPAINHLSFTTRLEEGERKSSNDLRLVCGETLCLQ